VGELTLGSELLDELKCRRPGVDGDPKIELSGCSSSPPSSYIGIRSSTLLGLGGGLVCLGEAGGSVVGLRAVPLEGDEDGPALFDVLDGLVPKASQMGTSSSVAKEGD